MLIGRTVADPGRDEKDQEHRQEAGKVLDLHEIHDADRRRAHGDEIPKRHDRPADFIGEQATERTRQRTDQEVRGRR